MSWLICIHVFYFYISGGHTVHQSFNFRFAGPESLSDEKLAFYRFYLSELKLIIIDEISLLPVDLLYKISSRLCEIFQNKRPFGGKGVYAVGDILQVRLLQLYINHI